MTWNHKEHLGSIRLSELGLRVPSLFRQPGATIPSGIKK